MCRFIFFVVLSCIAVTCTPAKKINGHARLNNVPANFLGKFQDDYGIHYIVSDSNWVQLPNIKYHLLRYDSAGLFFIARNAVTNPGEPGLYTRIDLVRFNSMEPWGWGFCLTTYNAKTVDEAINKQKADKANPKKGCGGYPFSRMKRE